MAWTGVARPSRAFILLTAVSALVSILSLHGSFDTGALLAATAGFDGGVGSLGGGSGSRSSGSSGGASRAAGGSPGGSHSGNERGAGSSAGSSGGSPGGSKGSSPGTPPAGGPQAPVQTGCQEGFSNVSGECLFACSTNLPVRQVSKPSHKGICLDDTTFSECSDRIPYLWPQTQERITSIRIFSPWKPAWPAWKRDAAWDRLFRFVTANNAQVLVGVEHTCNDQVNNQEWEVAKEFLTKLGPKRVMGVAIGNEMELLHLKTKKYTNRACQDRLWKQKAFWNTFVNRVEDLDRIPGFDRVTVTSVLGAFSLVGTKIGNTGKRTPFIEKKHAQLNSFLKDATLKYGRRFAFSFNFYPYFDPSFKPDAGGKTCWNLLHNVNCLGANCMVTNQVKAARQKALEITGRSDDIMWIGETGWSHPQSSTMVTAMKTCREWSSRRTFKMYYERFLNWDLSVESVRAPDHIFYFTMRDSVNFGMREHFGLISSCHTQYCKLQMTPGCHTAMAGETCEEHVKWAKESGIFAHPEWYPGLRSTSTPDDFQEHLYRNGHGSCPAPC